MQTVKSRRVLDELRRLMPHFVRGRQVTTESASSRGRASPTCTVALPAVQCRANTGRAGPLAKAYRVARCEVDEREPFVTCDRIALLPWGVSAGHLAPDLACDVARGTVLVSLQAIATELDVVVNAGVGGQEASRMPR